jgi:uncharacterized membrane-anchored protein
MSDNQFGAIQIQLDVCADEMENLTDWEREFIESISDQFTRSGRLSEKQKQVLRSCNKTYPVAHCVVV